MRKTSPLDYDMAVIGGGAAGLSVASGAAQLGAKVVLISDDKLGGDCLFYGCVPSKSLLKSAHVAHAVRNAHVYGLKPQEPQFKLGDINRRVTDIIKKISVHDSPERFRKMGADVIFGRASFEDKHTLKIALAKHLKKYQQGSFGKKSEIVITAKKIVIATGSRTFVPPITGLETAGYITHKEAFTLKHLPKTMVIIGGGTIGVEFGQAYSRLGTRVTILQRGDRILDHEDPDVTKVLTDEFVGEGMKIVTDTEVTLVKPLKKMKRVYYVRKKRKHFIDCDEILIATGRLPNIESLRLDNAGVESKPNGISTNAYMRTNVKHISAIGDVNGKFLFTHAAAYEASICVTNSILHVPKKVDYDSVPWTIFTDPELASCGLNERVAKKRGITYEVIKYGFSALDRAVTESENRGFVKVLITGKRGRIIGAQIIGPRAGEMIHEFVLAIHAGLSLKSILSAVHIYPTLAEINKSVAAKYYAPKLFNKRVRKTLRLLFGYRGKR
jgi:dihydrolipoamide dehydrogenase